MYHWIKINSALKWSHLKSGTVFCNHNLQFPNDFFPFAMKRKRFYIKMMYEGGWKFMILSCCKSFVLICFVSILLKLMEIICHLACPSWFEKRKKIRKDKTPQVHLSDLLKVWYKCAYVWNPQDAFNFQSSSEY